MACIYRLNSRGGTQSLDFVITTYSYPLLSAPFLTPAEKKYQRYYPHWSRDSVSPVCGIFLVQKATKTNKIFFPIIKLLSSCCKLKTGWPWKNNRGHIQFSKFKMTIKVKISEDAFCSFQNRLIHIQREDDRESVYCIQLIL